MSSEVSQLKGVARQIIRSRLCPSPLATSSASPGPLTQTLPQQCLGYSSTTVPFPSH